MKPHAKGKLLLGLLFLLGFLLLLYPLVSSAYYSLRQSRVIAHYEDSLQDGSASLCNDEALESAREYNRRLISTADNFDLTAEEKQAYAALLGQEGSTIGYLDIPALDLELPIYLGTEESVLQCGVGVMEGSSLPVGGEGTHTVLAGHRGLPSATLFTHLDRLQEGDAFTLHTLGLDLCYVVERVMVVEPQDMASLAVDPREDLCTLVTCTPYGINSHRLLIRGRRTETAGAPLPTQISSDGALIAREQVAAVATLGTVALWAVVSLLRGLGESILSVWEKKFHGRKGGSWNEEIA